MATRRMGKSLGNYIGVGEPAQVQFDKTMSIPDYLMTQWFELLTDRPADEIEQLDNPEQTHPRQAKEQLGKDIVTFYYGKQAAKDAAAEWQKRFSESQDPTDIPVVEIPTAEWTDGKLWICKLLNRVGFAASNGEARRAIEGGGVTMGKEKTKVTDPNLQVTAEDGLILRLGKRKIVQIRIV